MPRSGHRYPLTLYTRTIDRWWKSILAIGLVLLVLAGGAGLLPKNFPQLHYISQSTTIPWAVGAIGIFTILVGLFLLTMRKSAYVQPFDSHLRLVTPFLRLKISYRRIRQTTSVEMQKLFPLEQYKGWKKRFLRPLAGKTAVVLEMSGWPLSRAALGLYLSPFFFPDKTARLALLIPHWMDFSTELESFRGAWSDPQKAKGNSPQAELLRNLQKNKR